MELKMMVETITPQMAAAYLKANTDNYRRLNRQKVNQYASDIKNGLWQLNGETIVFDESGKLKNGQHRLAGIVAAGVPAKSIVVRGIADEVNIYDSGMTRSVKQISSANGIEVNGIITGAANIIANDFGSVVTGKSVQYDERNINELQRAYRCCGYGYAKTKKSSILAAVYLLLRCNKMPFYEIELFCKIFNTGEETAADGYEISPAMIARKQFESRFNKWAGRIGQKEQMDIITQALLDFHDHVERKRNYMVAEPFSFEKYLKEVRETDGL